MWFYDIEILPSLFLVVFKKLSGKTKIFELSPYKNNIGDLLKFLKKLDKKKKTMVGYNNISFDYPLLIYFFSIYGKERSSKVVKKTSDRAQEIIASVKRGKFQIRNPAINQIDLMIINTFDNPARSVSLDALKFVFHSEKIEVMDKSLLTSKKLTKEEVSEITSYCINDVNTTIILWNNSKKPRLVRDNLPDKFKHLYNKNDINLGAEQLLIEYCEATNQEIKDVRYITTVYNTIKLEDVIYDYLSQYLSVTPFKQLVKWLMKQEVDADHLNGAFTKIPDHVLGKLKKYCHIEYTKGLIKKLTLKYKEYKFTYGMGGLHSVNKSQIWKEDDEYFLVASDVASFHPSNIKIHNLYQEHLGEEFNKVYSKKLDLRLKEKEKNIKNQIIAIIEGYKLMLNGVFGKSLGDYGWLADKKMGLKITINNQLMITVLTLLHLKNIPGIKLIDSNTDGNYYKVPRKYMFEYHLICNLWEFITKMKLEHDIISKVIMRDGNNYTCKFENGYIKRKGIFVIKPELYQNHV